ncbi:ribosome biogenesis GTPase YqeH [Pullulanibacillus pueri]|uniref:Ribosome biogenesis GTPase YqeH n=1 Tax=Pullulanibacillus pueri TaxID=1437324 RepID=A0A8J2ZXQ8_9BACL|nr:ribosome biogenesis GTPase YqeH [Pullulanibacillus pueri]MBM7683079.1 ribosome biogenesis GTPase YqeH [Pullulanibacillus pueri]GGH84871.1 ribosome biogenesis GTPase YqeH [Pullulanibacillus pueri]
MAETVFCAGCGIAIQTEDEQAVGYAPASALKRDVVICKRCFRLKHYNEVPDISLTDDDFIQLLQKIGDTEALVVNIVDIFDFNGSWIPGLHRFVGDNDVLLVGNKADVLPKSTNLDKLKNWMHHAAKDLGLRPLDIFLMSAETSLGVDDLAAAIDHYRAGKDVYVVGATNVGKSTFINRLIERLGGDDRFKMTTSQFPGTTLNFIDLPLSDGQSLVDTPGIINHHQMAHYVDYDELKIITPKKEIKPKVYQLNEKQTLFLGGLARLDYIGPDRRSLVCYVSNELYIHRTKMENADALYEEQVGQLLVPPKEAEGFGPLVPHDFALKSENTDVVFSGLGWITVKGRGAQVRAYAPKGVRVTVRPSIIKG